MTFGQIINKFNHRQFFLLPKNKLFRFSLVLVAIFFISFLTKNILASDNYIKDKQAALTTGNNQEAWLHEALGSNLVSGVNILAGTIPDSILDGTDQPLTWIPSGALGTTNNFIASLYNQPASGIEYLAQVKDSFLGKPAYAQGIGFAGLQPLLPIWRAFRNITYVLFSLFFVVVGIMIMLRVKVSPQAVITVQSAIPGLITSLILVTFSYAIAGLIIDLTYLVQGFILSAIFTGFGKGLNSSLLTGIIPPSTFNDLNKLSFMNTFFLLVKNIGAGVMVIIGAALGAVIGTFFVPVLGTWGGAGIGVLLVLLIILIIVLTTMFKLLFSLIKCYVTLIIQIILGPIQIALGALPNSKMNFSSWFTQVLANAFVFPVVLIFLVLINVIAESISGTLWSPANIFPGAIMPFIIAFGGLLMVAKLPDLVVQNIFQLKPSPWGQAVGESFTNTIGKPAKFVGQASGEAVGDTIESNRDRNQLTSVLGYGVDAARTLGILKPHKH